MTATDANENTRKDQTRSTNTPLSNQIRHSGVAQTNTLSRSGPPTRTIGRRHRRDRNTTKLVENHATQPHPNGKADPYVEENNNGSSSTIMNRSPMNNPHNHIKSLKNQKQDEPPEKNNLTVVHQQPTWRDENTAKKPVAAEKHRRLVGGAA